MMNPAFSTAHMRNLTPIFYTVTQKLRDAIAGVVKSGPREVVMLLWTSRAALELIGQSGLGHSFDKLTAEEDNEYTSAVKNLLPLSFQIPVARRMVPWFPLKLRRVFADIVPFQPMRKLMHIVKIMDLNARQVIQTKRDAIREGEDVIKEQIAEGKDIMSILLRANIQEKESDRFPDSQLFGLMNGLIFAAKDTTSSALARILHILAQIQDRLRQEFAATRENLAVGTENDYDTLSEMPFLDAFCRETVRLYAPVPLNLRIAAKDTTLPLSTPITGKDGREIHEVHIPAGTTMFGGLLIASTSVTIWGPDALEFKPERWLSPLPERIATTTTRLPSVYSNTMTFWGGGSACLSFRFSQLELKVALSVLLPSFRFSSSDEQVCWRQSGLQFPSVEGTTSLELPLIVEALSHKG
ncbi:cytochrome P450 [Imleria badia]|nr:cytochrome P450 [Imleria badia]